MNFLFTETWDELGLYPIYSLLEELSLPQIPPLFTNVKSNYVIQLAKIKRILGSDLFFGAFVDLNPKNSKQNIVILGPPQEDDPFPRYTKINLYIWVILL